MAFSAAILVALALQNPPTATDPHAPPAYRFVHARTGHDVPLTQLADELARFDVVYFGELHDNVVGHQAYAKLAPLLAERRTDLVLSMEMFERDVQGVVSDYVLGRIDEETFLKHSRPWKDYARDYRPLVELARTRKLDVIAGNLPRPVASKISSHPDHSSPFSPRSTTAPQDRYWELFLDAMKGHPGAPEQFAGMYRAQCAKDDAMAEAMADYLATHPHRSPLLIHCNGNFHSDYGLGTAARLAQRVPLAQAAIISMVAVPDVAAADLSGHTKKAHYLLVVPAPPKPAETKATESKATESKATEPKSTEPKKTDDANPTPAKDSSA